MSSYQISDKADKDLADIYAFGVQEFGEMVAAAYIRNIERIFELLAASPLMGSYYPKDDCRRFPFGVHHIYYEPDNGGVKIIRIDDQRWGPEYHL